MVNNSETTPERCSSLETDQGWETIKVLSQDFLFQFTEANTEPSHVSKEWWSTGELITVAHLCTNPSELKPSILLLGEDLMQTPAACDGTIYIYKTTHSTQIKYMYCTALFVVELNAMHQNIYFITFYHYMHHHFHSEVSSIVLLDGSNKSIVWPSFEI